MKTYSVLVVAVMGKEKTEACYNKTVEKKMLWLDYLVFFFLSNTQFLDTWGMQSETSMAAICVCLIICSDD